MPVTPDPTTDDLRASILQKMQRNPRLAHQTLFRHRHPNTTPAFHWEIIDLWHSDNKRVLIKAFRGAAKSSIAEEAVCIQAAFRQFKNAIVLGETYERAVERLRAIKHEFETNEYIEELFGRLVGDTWSEGKIILSNGAIIQAFGRGQSLRGSKHLDMRPDRAFIDDFENEESVATEEALRKSMRWLMSVVMPAMDRPRMKIRINGTPLHPSAVIEQLSVDPVWTTRTYPIEHIDADGERAATWPDRFPLNAIDELKASYQRLGLLDNYAQEYMCKAEDITQKVFTSEMFRVEPTVRTWQAVYAMYDPARTVKSTSASTGKAVWSWINNRMIVWETAAGMWKPDEIIADMFDTDARYQPIVTGVEKDGLEEFIMQPLRHEQVRRQHAIPIRAMKAPKGKLDFIKGLQPFFKAREIIFVNAMPDAVAQFLSFPNDRIDIPNALAYALMLRPGMPMYDGFTMANVTDEVPVVAGEPRFLAINSTAQVTTAVLVQFYQGGMRVIQDWVREGDAGSNLGNIVREASLGAGGSRDRPAKLRVFAGPAHFSNYDAIGLRAAARRVPCDVGLGGNESDGREEIRALFTRLTRGLPAVLISSQARWTLNALSGGYCREVTKDGALSALAADGPYKVLMEGLESFAALMKSSIVSAEDQPVNYAYTSDGRRFISSRGTHGQANRGRQ